MGEVLRFYASVAEVSILHRYDVMSVGDQLLIFQDNIGGSSSRAEMLVDEASVEISLCYTVTTFHTKHAYDACHRTA